MKKLLVLMMMLVITIFNGCAPYTITSNDNNDEIIKKLKDDGKTALTYIGEYSYVSEPGQIIGTYYLDGNKAVVFTSLGRPGVSDNTKYEVYAGHETYESYLKIKTDSGDEYKEVHYPGEVFEKTSDDFSVSELEGVDCIIDLNDEMGGNAINSFEWLDNVIQKHGHDFGVFTQNGDIGRSTIYRNEWVKLADGICSGLQYKDGWIYYIDRGILYKVKEDGSENVQVYNEDIIDYTLEDGRILILKYVSGIITVCSLSYTGGEAQQIASVNSDEEARFNKIIGCEGDKVFLCSDYNGYSFEIFSVSGNNVDSVYYTAGNPDFLKPFLHNNHIYFVTYLNSGKLHRFDISSGEDSIVAESLYYVGRIIIE